MDKIKIISFVGINGLDKGIGPWAMPEDIKEPKDKPVLVKASRLSGHDKQVKLSEESGSRVETWGPTTQQVLGSGQPCMEGG